MNRSKRFRKLAAGVVVAAGFCSAAAADAPPRPKLAIVIDDFGLNYKRPGHNVEDSKWLALPFPLTCAVMPVSPNTQSAAKAVAGAGKELIMHVPFDRYLKLDFGPGPEPTEHDQKAVLGLLDKAFATIPGAKGLNNHQSLLGTRNGPMMRWFMGQYKKRGPGLYFLDSRVSPKSVAYAEARRAGIRAGENDIFLEDFNDPAYKKDEKAFCISSLKTAAAKARRKGKAVAIGHHYYQTTFDCVQEYAPQLQKDGIDLVFGSDVVQ